MKSGVSDAPSTSPRILRIAVAGNPNSGKTTIFNQLTGMRQKVANYPGVTVEKREGILIGTDIVLQDLPGTYSLSARSPDEEIARDVLLAHVEGTDRPGAILLVLDADNLERNLYLATQLLEFSIPMVIACNMVDVAEARGMVFDWKALSDELGVPVIPTVGKTGRGIAQTIEALKQLEPREAYSRPWALPEAFQDALQRTQAILREGGVTPRESVSGGALLWHMDYLSGERSSRESAERFLSRHSATHAAQLRAIAQNLAANDPDVIGTAIESRYRWISSVVERVRQKGGESVSHCSVTDRIDRVLTHRVFGLVFFAAVMFVLFLSVFSWAEPLMGLIEAGQDVLSEWVAVIVPEGPIQSLLIDGIINGVGSVLVFFPQICFLFLFVSILEDSGYMARAAFLMDRLMARVGLSGKSVIPLVSSYACAIPGIMATRTIPDRKDRLTTIMVAPLISCSARLPVYLIIIAAVFGERTWTKAVIMFSMYALSTLAALLIALLFKSTLFKGPRPPFIMELPPYHVPRPASILRDVWDRSKLFLVGAGTIIFASCVVIWALSYFPRLDDQKLPVDVAAKIAALPPGDEEGRSNIIAAEQLRHSILGRMGIAIEPAIEPLGFDWRIGIGIVSSFLAREVFVSTMGITFSLGEADESSEALRDQMAGATWPDGRTILTPLVGVGLMIFYVLACQCVSTLAIAKRETNSYRWPAIMFVYMTTLAYIASLCVYQAGRLAGLG